MATTKEVMKELGVSGSICAMWRSKKGFPATACKVDKKSGRLDWNIEKLKVWLRKWPVGSRGVQPSWFAAVGHKAAKKSA